MSDERDDPFKDWPEAGPDDWRVCPTCGNMDGGCPFCGHGYVPKAGFRWPGARRRGSHPPAVPSGSKGDLFLPAAKETTND